MLSDFVTVYVAELVRRARSRPFLVGMIVGAIGIVVLLELPAFMRGHVGTEQSRVIVAGLPALTSAARPLLAADYTIAGERASIEPPTAGDLAAVRAGRMIALSSDTRGLHVTVYSTDPSRVDEKRIAGILLPLNLRVAGHLDAATAGRIVNLPIDVRGVGYKFASVAQQEMAKAVAFILLFLLYLLVILNSQLTMSSVVDEKTNRVAELLVASIDPIALLYGKILAGATLGFVQMAAWIAAAAFVGLTVGTGGAHASAGDAPFDLANAIGSHAFGPLVVIAFVYFFVIGLLQFSTLFAGIGSLISRPEDFGAINGALVLPIVVALLISLAALDAPNAPFVVACSFIPFLAPFSMFARIAAGEPPLWQIATSAAINLAALLAIAVAAGRIYRVGMLLYGRAPSLKQVWTTIRG